MSRSGINWARASLLAFLTCLACADVRGQDRRTDGDRNDKRRGVRSVTIPVTVRLPPQSERQEEVHTIEALSIFEDGEQQEVLNIRGPAQSSLALAVLIQDDLASPAGNEIKGLGEFIGGLPAGTRVMVGYLRAGSLQVRQKFTVDLARAAKSLRIPIGSSSVSPYNPYTQLRDTIKKFEGQPVGRRAVLLVSDGLDISRGVSSSSPTQSIDLQRAINEAQRRGVAVYTIYSPSAGGTFGGGAGLVGNAQSALNRLASETGGHAFFQGTGAPVSYQPFLRDLGTMLSRQLALTYLSTHPSKGFHRVKVELSLEDASIRYPSGYTR